MQLNQYLFFDGRCEDAFQAYHTILGGEITFMLKHADAPAGIQIPPGWQDKIMHACLVIDGRKLMGSDAPPGREKPRSGFCVQAAASSVAEAERIFAALAEGGEVTMPLGPTFWSQGFGMLTDRFGVPWMIDCESGLQGSGAPA